MRKGRVLCAPAPSAQCSFDCVFLSSLLGVGVDLGQDPGEDLLLQFRVGRADGRVVVGEEAAHAVELVQAVDPVLHGVDCHRDREGLGRDVREVQALVLAVAQLRGVPDRARLLHGGRVVAAAIAQGLEHQVQALGGVAAAPVVDVVEELRPHHLPVPEDCLAHVERGAIAAGRHPEQGQDLREAQQGIQGHAAELHIGHPVVKGHPQVGAGGQQQLERVPQLVDQVLEVEDLQGRAHLQVRADHAHALSADEVERVEADIIRLAFAGEQVQHDVIDPVVVVDGHQVQVRAEALPGGDRDLHAHHAEQGDDASEDVLERGHGSLAGGLLPRLADEVVAVGVVEVLHTEAGLESGDLAGGRGAEDCAGRVDNGPHGVPGRAEERRLPRGPRVVLAVGAVQKLRYLPAEIGVGGHVGREELDVLVDREHHELAELPVADHSHEGGKTGVADNQVTVLDERLQAWRLGQDLQRGVHREHHLAARGFRLVAVLDGEPAGLLREQVILGQGLLVQAGTVGQGEALIAGDEAGLAARADVVQQVAAAENVNAQLLDLLAEGDEQLAVLARVGQVGVARIDQIQEQPHRAERGAQVLQVRRGRGEEDSQDAQSLAHDGGDSGGGGRECPQSLADDGGGGGCGECLQGQKWRGDHRR